MKHTLLYMLFAAALPGWAQRPALLDSIEANNTSLQALVVQTLATLIY
ncbi:hypothetical protein RFX70_20875 [Acinetobacter baumannii]|nr:hypothetical protein [Acinetobacter baumannii]